MTAVIPRTLSLLLIASVLCAAPLVRAETKSSAKSEDAVEKTPAEEITFRQDGRERTIVCRVVTEAEDGGVLAEADDGVLWMIERSESQSRKRLDRDFKPLSQKELSERLMVELPSGFRIHTTPHYLVAYNTSRAYAQWTGTLLERLHKAFTNYWENKGIELREPEFPLVVLVFADRQMYDMASREDLPGGTGNIIGFYSLRSNRVNMFDLTGAEAVRSASGDGGARRGSIREINQMLSQPAAVPLVATIVHEATHQIAFNCDLQQRYADIPLWLCEGMAVYFEAPDLSSTRGWQGIGKVNYPRLETFRQNLPNWQSGSLEGLISDSKRFRDPHSAVDAYADAWALNYYLIKYQPKAYTEYLKSLAEKRPLIDDDPKTRISEFRQHFGDLDRLEQDFLRQMSRVK